MYMETSGLSAPGSEAVIRSPIFQVGSLPVYSRTLVSVNNCDQVGGPIIQTWQMKTEHIKLQYTFTEHWDPLLDVFLQYVRR